jgi:hypothetical protein
MKVLFDTDTKTTAFIDSAGAATVVHPTEETVTVKADGTAINPATGQPVTQVPGFVSDLASLLTGKQGQTTPQGGSVGEREVREQYSLPGEVNVTAGVSRKVVELNGQGPGLMRVTTAKEGIHRIKMAGLPSGALTGEVSLIEGGVEHQVGSRNLDSEDFFTKAMQAGEVFAISLNKTGGDDKTEVAIEPQP